MGGSPVQIYNIKMRLSRGRDKFFNIFLYDMFKVARAVVHTFTLSHFHRGVEVVNDVNGVNGVNDVNGVNNVNEVNSIVHAAPPL